jgi:hypothetical protein
MSKWALLVYFIKQTTHNPPLTQDNSSRMAKLYEAAQETI